MEYQGLKLGGWHRAWIRQLRTLINISQKYPGSITLHGTSLLQGRTLSPSQLRRLFLLMFSITRGTARSQGSHWRGVSKHWAEATALSPWADVARPKEARSHLQQQVFFQISSVTEAHILSHSCANSVNEPLCSVSYHLSLSLAPDEKVELLMTSPISSRQKLKLFMVHM